MYQWVLGVDEAGRGPLAGPVAVGVVMVPHDFDIVFMIPGVADSKAISQKKREAVYARTQELVREGVVRYVVQFASAEAIDRDGITAAVRACVWAGVRFLAPEKAGVKVFLDGLLRAPVEYEQETIVHGDSLKPVISLASIMAKVERDHLMDALAVEYPQYGFEKHKGYGTAAHSAAIRAHGLSDMHRRSFCRAFI